MVKNDFCRHCGDPKKVIIRHKDGSCRQLHASGVRPKSVVTVVDCWCSGCGVKYHNLSVRYQSPQVAFV